MGAWAKQSFSLPLPEKKLLKLSAAPLWPDAGRCVEGTLAPIAQAVFHFMFSESGPLMAKKSSRRRPSDAHTPLAALRKLMADFVAERAWQRYHTARNLAASVCIEAAELLEHYQWLTAEEAAQRTRHDPAFRHAVGEELADVFLYLLSLANVMDLDITSTIHAKMEKNRRKYPAGAYYGHYERPAGSVSVAAGAGGSARRRGIRRGSRNGHK
ncbi:MAG TPA: nucleotide pyrophosphohydrolase [Phycisphaerae bacterium]|nr:nucleotide pyrophosphohydrolase [Phycisphaerae bacterium]